jgi:hypothetical protein
MGTATSTAAPERARWPRLAGSPQPLLRSLLPRGYAGFTEATAPRHLVLPATTSVPLVIKLLDSPHRPPAFVRGAHGSSTVVEGDCAPSYLEVWLTPLGAYTLLGLPMDNLDGQIVDLVDVLGAAGRRLGEQLRETPSWRQRFALMDRFLLRRLVCGPRPSPEVGWAWERLVATGGAVPIGRIADEVGWSHRHLIARFCRQLGLRPQGRGPAGPLRRGVAAPGRARVAGRGGSRPTPAMPTRRIWSATSASSPGPLRPSSWPARNRPVGMAGGRSIPFKTPSPPLLAWPEDKSSMDRQGRGDARAIGAVLGRDRGADTDASCGGDAGPGVRRALLH